MAENFSVRWNDFHSNLSQSFHALLMDKELVDVTLATGGQYLHAHKVVLSICSPYFKEIFKSIPKWCEHPVVILDVGHKELKQLLDFMYRGEVSVHHEELSSLLRTAEMLKIKGLAQGRERSESPRSEVEETPTGRVSENEVQPVWMGGEEIPTEVPPVPAVFPPNEEAVRNPLKRLLKNTPTKNSHSAKKKMTPVKSSPTHTENTEFTSDNEPLIDLDNEIFNSVLAMPNNRESVGWKTAGVKCPSCPRFFANRYNLKVHIRDKHEVQEGTLQCEICQKHMRNPSCLRVHMYHHRKQAAYLAQYSGQGEDSAMLLNKMRGERSLSGDYKDFDVFGTAAAATDRSLSLYSHGSDSNETNNRDTPNQSQSLESASEGNNATGEDTEDNAKKRHKTDSVALKTEPESEFV